jgi:hypothetical protein
MGGCPQKAVKSQKGEVYKPSIHPSIHPTGKKSDYLEEKEYKTMKNISIANTHRLYRKWVGHVVAQSGLLAFAANTLVVPAGLIVMALTVANGNGITIGITLVMVAVIGILLAILADGMTLSACARLRISLERIALIKEQYAQIPDDEKKAGVAQREQQELEPHEHSANISRLCIFFFALVSASAGTLFWHKLLETLPVWQAWTFSTLFSLLIAGTLIASELYKRANNEVVRESIVADHFSNEALLEDANEYAMAKLHEKYGTQIEEIGENTDTVRYAVEEHAISVYDNLLAGGKGLIPARIHREKVDKEVAIEMERNETARQLRLIKGGKEERNTGPLALPEVPMSTEQRVRTARLNNPNMTIRELAKTLSLSPSTIQRYTTRKHDAGSDTSV